MERHNLINQLIENMQLLSNHAGDLWEKFLTSRVDEGMKQIQIFFVDYQETLERLNLLKINNKLFTAITLSGINDILLRLEDAMSIPDYILMSDIFKYEIFPMVKEWENLLKEELTLIGDINEGEGKKVY